MAEGERVLQRLLRAAAATTAAKAAAVLLNAATLAVTARTLGPVGRGQLAVLLTLITAIATLGSLSLGQVLLSEARRDSQRTWLEAAVGSLLAVAATLTGLAAAAALTTHAWQVEPLADWPAAWTAMVVVAVPLATFAGYGPYLLLAVGRLSASNVAQVVAASAVLCAAVLLTVVVPAGVLGALTATLIGYAAGILIAAHVLRSTGATRPRWDGAGTRRLLRGGSRLHLNTVGTFLFASLDVLIVEHYMGTASAGVFHVALLLFSPLLLLPQALTDVLASRLSTSSADELWPSQRRLMAIVGSIMCAGALLLFVSAPLLIALVAGDGFEDSAMVFRIFLLAIPGAVLNGGMAIQWIARGYFGTTSLVTLGAGCVNIVANIVLIPRFGLEGAAWATVIAVYALPVPANLAMWVHAQRASRRALGVAP